MQRIPVGNGELACEVIGEGEPVLFIHGGVSGRAFAPLVTHPLIRDSYQVINYHRRGYGESSRHTGPFSIADQARDAAAVLRHADVERAHIVGHSYGAATALQLTLDSPETVHSLALLEPPIPGLPSTERFFAPVPDVVAKFQAGDRGEAVDAFMRMVCGPEYRGAADANLPAGWFEEATVDLDTLLTVELPALAEWQFNAELAERIGEPTMAVVGAVSDQYFFEGNARLLEWIPQVERFVLPDAAHGLQFTNPEGMAQALAAFLAKHPMRAPVAA